jgi:hypothetical protein
VLHHRSYNPPAEVKVAEQSGRTRAETDDARDSTRLRAHRRFGLAVRSKALCHGPIVALLELTVTDAGAARSFSTMQPSCRLAGGSATTASGASSRASLAGSVARTLCFAQTSANQSTTDFEGRCCGPQPQPRPAQGTREFRASSRARSSDLEPAKRSHVASGRRSAVPCVSS